MIEVIDQYKLGKGKDHPKLAESALLSLLFSSHKHVGWWIDYSILPICMHMCMVLCDVHASMAFYEHIPALFLISSYGF